MAESEDKPTYKLGATAPTLETIRDFLRDDHKNVQAAIDQLSAQIDRLIDVRSTLQERVNMMDEVALDLLDDIIERNANTTFQVVE